MWMADHINMLKNRQKRSQNELRVTGKTLRLAIKHKLKKKKNRFGINNDNESLETQAIWEGCFKLS